MQSKEKQAVIEAGLAQAFGKLSDITPLVLSTYYDRYPQAKAVFGEHGYDQVAQLEASMIDSALYFVETWFHQPKEIQETIEAAIPQHESLKIPVPLMLGLLEALLDIIIGPIPSIEAKNTECVGGTAPGFENPYYGVVGRSEISECRPVCSHDGLGYHSSLGV